MDAVIATAQLEKRPARRPDGDRETEALLKLQRQLAESPGEFFDSLVKVALELSGADSTGISLLNASENCFVWPAVAGPLVRYLGEGTPREFGPCGTVLDRNQALLMIHPERHFGYLTPIAPSLEEVLLIPFYMDGKAVGTIWAVIHDPVRKFDVEDRRLLESLSEFAASAYRALATAGLLRPFLKRKAG